MRRHLTAWAAAVGFACLAPALAAAETLAVAVKHYDFMGRSFPAFAQSREGELRAEADRVTFVPRQGEPIVWSLAEVSTFGTSEGVGGLFIARKVRYLWLETLSEGWPRRWLFEVPGDESPRFLARLGEILGRAPVAHETDFVASRCQSESRGLGSFAGDWKGETAVLNQEEQCLRLQEGPTESLVCEASGRPQEAWILAAGCEGGFVVRHTATRTCVATVDRAEVRAGTWAWSWPEACEDAAAKARYTLRPGGKRRLERLERERDGAWVVEREREAIRHVPEQRISRAGAPPADAATNPLAGLVGRWALDDGTRTCRWFGQAVYCRTEDAKGRVTEVRVAHPEAPGEFVLQALGPWHTLRARGRFDAGTWSWRGEQDSTLRAVAGLTLKRIAHVRVGRHPFRCTDRVDGDRLVSDCEFMTDSFSYVTNAEARLKK
jgi:hypothetical protein